MNASNRMHRMNECIIVSCCLRCLITLHYITLHYMTLNLTNNYSLHIIIICLCPVQFSPCSLSVESSTQYTSYTVSKCVNNSTNNTILSISCWNTINSHVRHITPLLISEDHLLLHGILY